jgi:hypothetical protein
MSKAAAIQNIVFSMASNVFDGITPVEQRPKVARDDVQNALLQLGKLVNSSEAFEYLTVNDGIYAKQITSIIKKCMQDVMEDKLITISDIPILIKAIKDLASSVNDVNDKLDAVTKIGSHTLVPVLELVVCLVAQMIFNSTEYTIARNIISLSFELLQTEVFSVRARGWFCL